MTGSGMIHNTFVVERSYPQPPAQVFAAFAQADKKRKWYAEGDHELEEYVMDFKVGGGERLRYRFKEGHPIAGMTIENVGSYKDIVPEQRIVEASSMRLNGTVISVTLVTLEFREKDGGTDLVCTHQGVFYEGSGGWEMRKQGWESLFAKLTKALDA